MSQETTTPTKKTRLKGTATKKTCVACKVEKDRFKDFKPRWSRCSKHRIKGTKTDPNCTDCQKVVNGNIRQPRCVECDAKRTTKKGKKVTTPTPTAATPVAAPAPVAEPVTVAPVATAAAPAPEATQVQAPAPVAPTPTVEAKPEPVAVTVAAQAEPTPAPRPKAKKPGLTKLADLAKLLDSEPTGSDASPH